ncbi:unnamed protein product [Ostreobium quekettii]|uniref:Uncharacterized protein n=1 Tax=Ostreobium quekettii TaxID=121088 RepID=A0A8S1IU06_9CHLO|nr:unnamed protein product [Ostreobium quekettii]
MAAPRASGTDPCRGCWRISNPLSRGPSLATGRRTAPPGGPGRSLTCPCYCRRTFRESKKNKSKFGGGSGSHHSETLGGVPFKVTLAWGDVVMMAATHLASDMIPLPDQPALITTSALAWFMVALLKGDYAAGGENQPSSLAVGMGLDLLNQLTRVMLTWLLFVPTAFVCYGWLVPQHLVDATVVLGKVPGRQLSAELEVLLAALITLTCWRGIYARIRWR